MSDGAPKPWKAIIWGNETYPYPLDIVMADGSGWVFREGEASSLDAVRLAAAAPDLLEALKALVEVVRNAGVEWCDGVLDAQDRARAAIAKAEGRES